MSQVLQQGLAAAVNGQLQADGAGIVDGFGELAGVHVVGEQGRPARRRYEEVAGAGNVAGGGDDLGEDGIGVAVVVNQPAGQGFPGEELLGFGDDLVEGAGWRHRGSGRITYRSLLIAQEPIGFITSAFETGW